MATIKPEFYVDTIPYQNDPDLNAFYTKLKRIISHTNTNPDIKLLYHTNNKAPNTWNIKKSYIVGYLYFDKNGYSGWAEMADSEKLFNESQQVDYDTAKMFFDSFTKQYIRKNKSKIIQHGEDFKLNDPYVFVVGQDPNDTVSTLARIDTIQLMKDVAEAYANTEYKVVIKIHPRQDNNLKDYTFLNDYENVIISDDKIHSIIQNATAVYTVNSTVGFESLLHLKQVFTSGHCDYHWVTKIINDKYDISSSIERLTDDVDEEAIIKFIYYMLNEYFVNAHDSKNIKQKIEMTINEYKTRRIR